MSPIISGTRDVMLLLGLLASARPGTTPPARGPAVIILVRHGDEPTDPNNPHLAPAGVKRSQDLMTFITKDPAMVRLGRPFAAFATKTTKHGDGQRTQETITPLAHALNLQVQTPYQSSDFAPLAKAILADPAYAGKTIIICWNHEELPQLAAALGVTPMPPKWKASVYDLVYIISYQGRRPILRETRYGDK